MKKVNFGIMAFVAAVLLLGNTGCKSVDPVVIETGLTLAANNGAYYGLQKWAKTKPDAANECARTLKENIETALIPYLNGNTLPSSEEVSAFINSSLFKNINEEVKEAIIAVSVALDSVLPIPDAKTYLSKQQVKYIKCFMTGLAAGCERFMTEDKNLVGNGNVKFGTKWLK